jgi:hypothetical protein
MGDDREEPLSWGKYKETPICELPEAYVGWALGHLLEDMRTKIRQCRALRAQLDQIDEECRAEIDRLLRELA